MVTVKFDHGPLKVIVTQDHCDVMQGGHWRACAFDKNGAIIFCAESCGGVPRGQISERERDGWIMCEIMKRLNEAVMCRRQSKLMGE